ncbi:glycoside hydrolase family 114 protein, partial [Piromyces sp. E2]
MKFSLSFATLALLLASNAQARTSFSQRDSFNIAFRDFEVSKEKADVIEISLEKDKSIIDQLHRNGKKVVCYFSGGTVETYRDYFKEYKSAGILKNRYSAWSDEYWIDYRISKYQSLIKQRIRTAVQKGCDAIDVDNVDGYQVHDVKKWDHPLSKDDAIKFTSWLGKTAHEMGISIGLKNCLDIVDTVGKYYDFAVNERCAQKGECHWYKNYLKTGKPVFSISYGGMS